MLKSMLVNWDVVTLVQIGWQVNGHPIRNHVTTALLTNMDLNMLFLS